MSALEDNMLLILNIINNLTAVTRLNNNEEILEAAKMVPRHLSNSMSVIFLCLDRSKAY